jgi:hypothetical protein
VKLPANQVGISDINTYCDCPVRFEYAIRRWTEGSEPPERKHPDTMYGSAIHHAIHIMEAEVLTVDEAVQRAFDEYSPYLDPEDMKRLEDDLATYVRRDYKGVRTIANETEVRVPLFNVGGQTIYFRAKLDRVYERIASPGSFIHIDYKSSKWRKTEKEVHEDVQMWAYNMAIFEWWPECERLTQVYDQLMYGAVPTRKSAGQRAQMKVWLERQVRAVLNNDNPEPKFNQWCPYCPLLPDCPEPKRTAEFAAARIAALAPASEPGGKLVLDPDMMDVYVAELPELKTAKKAIEEFEKKVAAAIKDMPEAVRAYHGYRLGGRRIKGWTPEALRKAHEMMGDEFYALVKMTKGRLKDYLGDDKQRVEELMGLAEFEASQPTIQKLGD